MKEKNESIIQFKIKQEELKSSLAIVTFKIKNIEKGDIIGLDEAIEIKKRFYSVKSTSPNSIVYSVNINVINFKLYLKGFL